MKEIYYYWKKVIKNLYNDIFKYVFIMCIPSFLIIYVIQVWRFKPIAYILAFLICLIIATFLSFRKGDIKNEFKENQ
jgi:hypothetical protein